MATLVSASIIRNTLLDTITGRIESPNIVLGECYLALSSTAPSYTATGEITGITEPPSAQGYKRKLIGHYTEPSTILIGAASKGEATNEDEIHFDQATEAAEGGTGWGNAIKYFAIYKTNTGGSPILAGELTTEITVSAGYVVIIKAGDFKISMNPVTGG